MTSNAKRFRFLPIWATVLSALFMAGCVTTGGPAKSDSSASGSGVTVYGTVDVGVSR